MKIQNLALALILLVLVGCGSDAGSIGITPVDSTNGEQSLGSGDGSCGDQVQHLGANIVLNGSFEEGHNLGNNRWNVFEEVGAWKADLTYNDAGIEIQNGQSIGGLAPSDGDAKLEFDAHNRNGFTASDVEVYQEIDTDASVDYVLTFDYSPRVEGNTDTNKAEVYWDGNLIATLNAEVKGWQTYTIVVSGVGAATRLSFQGHIDNDTVGGYLDNVKLKPILEDEVGSTGTMVFTSCLVQ